MSRDHYDALIDQLLRETLGGDRPRDMTARVLAQAKIMDRFRRRNWYWAGLGLAAALALAVGLTMYWPKEYPNPSAEGVYVMNGGDLQRGARLETPDGDGSLKLGGYVEIAMAPQTALTIGGSKYEEKVLLDQGHLDVRVTKHKGQFDIGVGPATVHVTGTQFGVNVAEETTPTTRIKKLVVSVNEGSVEVQGVPGVSGVATITAGNRQEFSVSSMPVIMPPKVNTVPPVPPGTQPGTRGGRGPVIKPNPPSSTTRVVPPAAGMTQPVAGGTLPVKLTTTPGSQIRYGKLRRSGDLFYLECTDGNYFMFQQGTVAGTHPKWLGLGLEQSSRVVWMEGVVTDIVQAGTATGTRGGQ